MKFIVKYRVSQDALDVLFGALKKAEHEGIQFLGCFPDEAEQPAKLNGVKKPRKTVTPEGKWVKRVEYYDEITSQMSPGKFYDIKTFAGKLHLVSKFKNGGQELTYSSKQTLLDWMVRDGKLARKDNQISLLDDPT